MPNFSQIYLQIFFILTCYVALYIQQMLFKFWNAYYSQFDMCQIDQQIVKCVIIHDAPQFL